MGMIKKTTEYKEARIMEKSLYKTLVRPHVEVEYCVSASSPYYK